MEYAHGVITQGKPSLFLSTNVFFTYLMSSLDFTNDQNTMRGVCRGYIYTLNIKIRTEDNTSYIITFTISQDTFAKLGG